MAAPVAARDMLVVGEGEEVEEACPVDKDNGD